MNQYKRKQAVLTAVIRATSSIYRKATCSRGYIGDYLYWLLKTSLCEYKPKQKVN